MTTRRRQQQQQRIVTFTKKTDDANATKKKKSKIVTQFSWIRECFRIKGTVVQHVFAQMLLAFLIGLFANALKIERCGTHVASDQECDVAFSVEGHTSVAVVLSFLLVFRVNLAYEKWDEAREAVERVRDGVRNLNVAFCSFVCGANEKIATPVDSSFYATTTNANNNNNNNNAPLTVTFANDSATTTIQQNADDDADELDDERKRRFRDRNAIERKELARLSQLLFAFFRISIRESRIGYSDTLKNADSSASGMISATEVIRFDRAGKPSLLDLLQDPIEIEAFVHLEPFNRVNAVVQKILDIIEKKRRLGTVCERGAVDIYRDCASILAGIKTCERIISTPTPNKYRHMLTTLLFFFVYSAPFCFTATFDWLTPMPSALLAMAFYGVAEVAKKLESPFGWEKPSHDLSQLGAELFEDVARIHESRNLLLYKRNEETTKRNGSVEDALSSQRSGLQRYFSAVGKHRKNSLSGSESSEDINRTRPLFPPGDSCVSINAARRVLSREVRDKDLPPVDRVRRGDDVIALVKPSSFRIDFILDIFQWRDTILPDVVPQVLLAICLAVFAQGAKFLSCGSQVTDASQCLIAMDPTAHGIAAIALGFLLVFRADWAYDRYYEAKECLGRLHVALRNVNVITSSFLRPIDYENGEKPYEGDYEYSSARKTKPSKEKFDKDSEMCEEAKMEILRLTNIAYASVRVQVREARVGDEFGRAMNSECILTEDPYGCPKIPDLLLVREEKTEEEQPMDSVSMDASTFKKSFADVPVPSRCAFACLQIQRIIEHQRRLGHISERAAFEVYQTLEETLAALRAANRVATTPIPRAFTHLLQLVLFSFVFTAPFVFSVTFKWIAFIPSGIVVISCYGINEMGTAMADPFNWTSPSHDLSELGRRLARESAQIHEFKRIFLGRYRGEVLSVSQNSQNDFPSEDIPPASPEQLQVAKKISDGGGIASKQDDDRARNIARVSEKLFNNVSKKESLGLGASSSSQKMIDISTSVQKRRFTKLDFFTGLFSWKNTVLPGIVGPTLFAGLVSLLANYTKVKSCGRNVTSHQDCVYAFSDTAHSICGGIIGFTLCFRASIAYFRYYEAKKFMGALCESARNFACGSLAFLRPDLPGELRYDEGAISGKEAEAFLNSVELLDEFRRLSNCLFGLIRHIVRETRHGVRREGSRKSTSIDYSELISDDPCGNPSLSLLLTGSEMKFLSTKLPASRPALIVAKCQKLVEEARKRNEISERGAFDLYSDLNDCLQACNNLERISETKMPWIYLHLLNFALFAFVFSAPFIFTAGFGWLSPAPAMLVAIAFYGTAEVSRNMENPFDYDNDGHDIEAAGLAHYKESRMLRQATFIWALPHSISTILSSGKNLMSVPLVSKVDAVVDAGFPEAIVTETTSVDGSESDLKNISDDIESVQVNKTVEKKEKAVVVSGKIEAESRSHARVFRDIFKFRNTVWSKLIPQCVMAGLLACLAQAAKVWKCGSDVRDLTQCQVTFSKDAHTAVASILAFVIVYRFRYAYERYYEAKVSLEKLRCALRNVNLGVSAFVDPRLLFTECECVKVTTAETHSMTIRVSPRAHVLRLTTLFFALTRVYLREATLEFGPNNEVIHCGDKNVLVDDRYSGGAPNLGRLLDKHLFESEKDDDRLSDDILQISDPVGRLNFVATKMHALIENLRINSSVCDRGTADIHREIRRALSAVTSCHRAAHTQTPRVLVHAINVIVFFFVFSSPLLFTASFKYAAFWPAILVALCFYGVLEVGERLEKPFGWEKPNHDLSIFGQKLWSECEALHEVVDDSNNNTADYEAIMKVKQSVSPTLARSKTEDQDLCKKLEKVNRVQQHHPNASSLPPSSSATDTSTMEKIKPARGKFNFITELFQMRGTIYANCVPQLLCAVFVAYFATILKEVSCGKLSNSMNTGDCFVSFDATAHRLTGVVVGFALSHIAHVAYRKWYEVLCALDEMYNSARSINVMTATCIGHNNGNTSNKKIVMKRSFFSRSANDEDFSKQKALNFFYSVDSVHKGEVDPLALQERIRRLLDLALVFAKRSVRDHRLGVPVLSYVGGDIEKASKGKPVSARGGGIFVIKALDNYDMDDSSAGEPTVAGVLAHMKNDANIKNAMAETSQQSRASVCVAELQRTVEFARKNALVSDEAAFDCYNYCEEFLQSQTTILRVVDTPVPKLYRHIALTTLFFYAFSAPFSFASTFGWLSPVPSAVLVLGFYGAAAVGEVLIDPLSWSIHSHDANRASRRVILDNDVIYNSVKTRSF